MKNIVADKAASTAEISNACHKFGYVKNLESVTVVGVGSAIVDIFCEVDDDTLAEFGLEKGTMSLIDADVAQEISARIPTIKEQGGGSVANTMVGIAGLGVPCSMTARVEQDLLGLLYQSELRLSGVELNPLVDPSDVPLGTGRCFVLVTPDAERTMLTYLGASASIGRSEVETLLQEPPEVTYFEGYLLDCPGMIDHLIELSEASAALRRITAISLSDPELVKRHQQDLWRVIRSGVSVIFGNSEEVANLTGVDDPMVAAQILTEAGIRGAITLGANGALGFESGETVLLAAEETEVVDTTGAGDQFAAGWLAGLAKGLDLRKRTKLGLICAAEVISHFGARPNADLLELATRIGLKIAD